MRRSIEQYANCTPDAVASGSKAQMMFFVEDAKADIKLLSEDNKKLREIVKRYEAMPDLLSALKAALRGLEGNQHTPNGEERYQRALAAIAKAEAA